MMLYIYLLILVVLIYLYYSFTRDNIPSQVDKIDYDVGQCPNCKLLSSLADFGRENLINKPCGRCGTIIKIIPYSQRL